MSYASPLKDSKKYLPSIEKHKYHIQDNKLINDPVHGHIRLDSSIVKIIDTPQFQRLRDLKQLGSCYYVFPGASHNRFEHCIGVSHLANELITRIQKSQPELEISDRTAHLITVAGLCHDLGHGPFSHVFDNEFIPRVTGSSAWTHEQASVMMLHYMIDDNCLDYSSDDIKFLEDLIEGNRKAPDHIKYLYQIVANKTNSVDVDKFDYLARDTSNLGLKASYDFTRLMQYSKVIDGEICYYAKEAYNLYEMFHTRYSLHKMIYTHRAGKAVEYMITDALVEANAHLRISDSISDPEQYVNMTDCILRQIESSRDQELASAQAILKRLRKRDLYKFVDEILVYPSFTDSVTEAEILSYQNASTTNLQLDDIIVHDLKINYAMKDKNPVSHVKFYQSGRTDPFYLEKESVSMLIPESFQERYIRLYVRDKKNIEAAAVAFKRWAKMMKAKSSTPKKVKMKVQPEVIPHSPHVFPERFRIDE